MEFPHLECEWQDNIISSVTLNPHTDYYSFDLLQYSTSAVVYMIYVWIFEEGFLHGAAWLHNLIAWPFCQSDTSSVQKVFSVAAEKPSLF